MGVLTDFIVAEEREAQAVAAAPRSARTWPSIDAKGIDQIMLGSLWSLLTARQIDVDQVLQQFAMLEQVSDEGPWMSL